MTSPDTASAPHSAPRRGVPRAWWLALVIVLVADQVTKSWAVARLGDGSIIRLVGTLQLRLVYNRGMAFSRGEGLGPLIGLVASVVAVVLVVWLRRAAPGVRSAAVMAILAGAVGNVIDRLTRSPGWMRGPVVDFVDVQWWPVFNVADAAITCGAVTLVVLSFVPQRDGESDSAARPVSG
ncbi:MAG: signal peptidase II [Ilumatobacteraceae bacterium]|jgi:signal peptidase II